MKDFIKLRSTLIVMIIYAPNNMPSTSTKTTGLIKGVIDRNTQKIDKKSRKIRG